MSLTVEQVKVRNQELIEEVLEVYPEKTAKRRAKHLSVYEEGTASFRDSVASTIFKPPTELVVPGSIGQHLQAPSYG